MNLYEGGGGFFLFGVGAHVIIAPPRFPNYEAVPSDACLSNSHLERHCEDIKYCSVCYSPSRLYSRRPCRALRAPGMAESGITFCLYALEHGGRSLLVCATH